MERTSRPSSAAGAAMRRGRGTTTPSPIHPAQSCSRTSPSARNIGAPARPSNASIWPDWSAMERYVGFMQASLEFKFHHVQLNLNSMRQEGGLPTLRQLELLLALPGAP